MTVLFLHIPKTAGTTFRAMARSQYDRVFQITGHDRKRDLARMLVVARLKPYGIVMGHTWWEMRRLLPGPVPTVTFLRDPVDRVISAYYFMRDRHSREERRALVRDLSLMEFVRTQAANDGQVRRLIGWRYSARDRRAPLDERMGALAIRRLDELAAFGTVELFERSVERIADALGWTDVPAVEPRNVNPDPPQVSAQDREEIRQHNRLDQRLWETAMERLA